MGKIDGNLFRIKIGTVNIGATNSVSFTLKKDYQKTTNQDSAGWDELHATAGVRSISGSFDGFYDPDGVLNAEEIADMIIGNTGLVTIQVGQAGVGNTNGVYYSFLGVISQVDYSAKNDSPVTFKGNFESSGAVTKAISTGSAGS
jgi:predicted secreted protein